MLIFLDLPLKKGLNDELAKRTTGNVNSTGIYIFYFKEYGNMNFGEKHDEKMHLSDPLKSKRKPGKRGIGKKYDS